MTDLLSRVASLRGHLHAAAIALFLSSIASVAFARDVPDLRGHVNDYAALLTHDEESQLEQKLSNYEQSTRHQFALLTIPSLDGEPIEEFGIHVGERWKLGEKKVDDGLVLIVAANDHKMRIEVGYGLEGVVPDAIAARIVREVLAPSFRAQAYASGINQAFDALIRQTNGDQPLPTRAQPPQPRHSSGGLALLSPLLLPFILFGVFSLLSGGGRRRRYYGGGPFIGGVFGGGGGGSDGGGFSGGGGGFGGGGASGDW